MKRGAFYTHLADAIALNNTRRPYYARQTRGQSKPLSSFLIPTHSETYSVLI